MLNPNEFIVIANIKHRVIAWTPPKTASTSADYILSNLGFIPCLSDGTHLSPNPKLSPHNHTCRLFDSHETYKLLSTIRNPYDLMVSIFKNSYQSSDGYWNYLGNKEEKPEKNKLSLEEFDSFLNSYFYGKESGLKYFECYNYLIRKPDYIIRTESMFEDYIKIPFVVNTEYYSSGKLYNDCQFKRNKSHVDNLDFRTLYSQSLADIVYYNLAHVFELGGYDKNSWKR